MEQVPREKWGAMFDGGLDRSGSQSLPGPSYGGSQVNFHILKRAPDLSGSAVHIFAPRAGCLDPHFLQRMALPILLSVGITYLGYNNLESSRFQNVVVFQPGNAKQI